MAKSKPTVLAYYFPNRHVDPQNEQWHGKGRSEGEVLKYARPRFEGHRQPKAPLRSYKDESDPSVMAKNIDPRRQPRRRRLPLATPTAFCKQSG